MDKYLAVPLPDKELTPIEINTHLRNNYTFIAKEDDNMAMVLPYVILTDGKEAVIYENKDKEIEIGFRNFMVRKSDVIPKNNPNYFDTLMNSSMLGSLSLSFTDIRTREDLNKPNKPQEPPGREVELPVNLVHPHQTNRAILSLDKKYILPIYFLVFPNNRLIKFLALPDMPGFRTVFLTSLTKTGLAQFKLSSVAKTVLVMIGVGEIVFPIVSESDDITR